MADNSSLATFGKKTFVGVWWLPGETRQCHGTLTFDVDGEQKLRIVGYFEENFSDVCKKYDVIYGLCEVEKKIRKITVFGAWITHIPTPQNGEYNVSETSISFTDVWIGNCHYESQDSICFESFSFGLNNLENWLNEHKIFTVEFDKEFTKITAGMNIPAAVQLFSDKNVSISISYCWKAPDLSLGQTEATMRCCPRILIKANGGTLRYYGNENSFSFYISWIFQLFELFMLGHTFPFSLNGKGPTLDDCSQQEQSYILYSRDITVKQKKEIQPHEVLFPYQKVQSYLPELTSNFQKSYLAMGSILEVLCSSLCTSSYNIYSLSILIFNFEGLYKLFYSCPKSKKEPTLKERLCAMLMDISSIFTFLDNDMCNKLASDYKEIRNAGAHSDSPDQATHNFHLYILKIHFVQFIQIAIILKSCGLPDEVIKECFESSYPCDFRTISDELKTHYSSIEGEAHG